MPPTPPSHITSEQVQKKVADLERLITEEYQPQHPPKKRDWRTYEQQWAHRLHQAMRDLAPLVQKACALVVVRRTGPPHVLTLEQRVQLLLIKILNGQSNRRMAGMLETFSLLSGLDVNYKTIERLYSDPDVAIALENLHVLMLQRRGVRRVDVSGDGTGFTLSITRHYATIATREKEKAKETSPPEGTPAEKGKIAIAQKKVQRFVYSFRLLVRNFHITRLIAVFTRNAKAGQREIHRQSTASPGLGGGSGPASRRFSNPALSSVWDAWALSRWNVSSRSGARRSP